MEHIIDNAPIVGESSAALQNTNNNQNKSQNNKIFTREEKETNLFNNFKRAFSKTFDNLNVIRNENNKDNNTENLSVIDDDNVSIASSKILSVGNKTYKNSKLPLYYGTKEFDSSKYLGLVDEANPSVVVSQNNFAVENPNLNSNNNNNLYLPENMNSRSQTNVYNNSNDNLSPNIRNPGQNPQILNNLDGNNSNNYRNYDQNYDYNNSRPSGVSELARPNFQQLMDQEISLGLNKKTSMEFNLLNNNNVNFMPNQSMLNPNNNYQNTVSIINFFQPAANIRDQTKVVKNIKPLNIKGKAPPKAPPLPAHIQQLLRKISRPKVPSHNTINSKIQNISVKLTKNFNSDVLRNPQSIENRNANNPTQNETSDALNGKAQENSNKTLSFKENLSLMMRGVAGKPLVMQPKNSIIENSFNERENGANVNNFNNNSNQNTKNNFYAGASNEAIGYRNNEARNPIANNDGLNNNSHIVPNNALDKQKSVNLGNFVRKSTLFEEEDEEEDNTGLFRRATSNNINLMLNKKNTQNKVTIQEEINNNLTSHSYEQKYINSSSNNNLNDSKNTYNNFNNQKNERLQNTISDENTNKNVNKLSISSQRSILKNKGLESNIK